MIRILFIVLALLAGCTTVKVRSDQAVNFDQFKTFYCLECQDEFSAIAPEYDNTETRALIREAIITELERKGLTYTEEDPDILLSLIHI